MGPGSHVEERGPGRSDRRDDGDTGGVREEVCRRSHRDSFVEGSRVRRREGLERLSPGQGEVP